jgi:uncharacterized protein
MSASPPRPRRSLWHFVRRILIILATAYLGLLVVMMFLERSLIFFPSRYPEGNWHPPGLQFEDAEFRAADGTRLHGWFVPHKQPRAVVLLAHGNGGNLSDRVDLLDVLHDHLQVATLIFDYRGYGRSEDRGPDEAGILADARAARAWLAKRSGIKETDFVLFGESLGGGVMVDLAASDGARGLVLLNTFSSLPDVAAWHYPWLPVRLLMRTRLDSAAKIADYHGPLLQCHGDRDRIVPLRFAQRLFDAANEPKQLILIPGGDHNDSVSPKFWAALDKFLTTLPPVRPN